MLFSFFFKWGSRPTSPWLPYANLPYLSERRYQRRRAFSTFGGKLCQQVEIESSAHLHFLFLLWLSGLWSWVKPFGTHVPTDPNRGSNADPTHPENKYRVNGLGQLGSLFDQPFFEYFAPRLSKKSHVWQFEWTKKESEDLLAKWQNHFFKTFGSQENEKFTEKTTPHEVGM